MSEFELSGICLTKYHGDAKTVVVPESVRVVGENAFAECGCVKEVRFTGALYEIGHHGFLNCSNLRSVSLPEKMFSISEDSFFGCLSLEHFTVPDGVWSLGSRTFKRCPNLKTLTIPDSVSNLHCLANLERGAAICAHKGSAAETLAKQHGFSFQPLPGTVKAGFHPEVSYNGTVVFYDPSKGIHRYMIERGFFLRDQFPGYGPPLERTPYFERTCIPERFTRRMIFSRAGGGFRADMTLFCRSRDVRKEFGCKRMDFYAYLDSSGCYTSGFKPLPAGTYHPLEGSLGDYQQYLGIG